MPTLPLRDLTVYYTEAGRGAPVMLAHPEGMSSAIWDGVDLSGYRVIRYDLRGHGRSGCPTPPYSMGALIRDAEVLMDALGIRDAVFVGLGLGGLIAQGLAVKRLDLVRGLVLSNTAAKIPATGAWQALQASEDMAAITEPAIDRWFARNAREGEAAHTARALMQATDPAGYAGCAAAMHGTDFYTTTATLTLPTLVTAGMHDAACPPDLVRETADLILGAEFRLMRCGHLPPLERHGEYASLITGFLQRIGH